MRIVNLGDTNSILNKFVAELRDVDIQKDSLRFRRNVERIGEIMAYEISKEFHYSTKDIQSPPGIEPFISVYSKTLIDCTFTTLSFMKAIELTLH